MYHVIWCPKYRRGVLGGAAELRLKQFIGEVVAEVGAMVIEVETMPVHVHLLVELPPRVAVFTLVEVMKGCSSRRLRGEFGYLAGMKCLWARPWLVCTVGGAPLEVVRRDVENQKLSAARKQTA
jgi:putative transposase